MKLFNWFKSSKQKEPKQKKYIFEVMEAEKVGDLYEYTVEAESHKEAFDKLVKYFFGEESNQEVKQRHLNVIYPSDRVFRVSGMPRWFGKKISGYNREDNIDYHDILKDYCNQNNIKLRKNL